MKVCKKCKKKVANKAKICRFCGADVSKAKIIPNKNNNEKYKNNKKQIQIQVNDKEIKVQNLQIKNESNKKNKLDFIKAIPKKINVKNIVNIKKIDLNEYKNKLIKLWNASKININKWYLKLSKNFKTSCKKISKNYKLFKDKAYTLAVSSAKKLDKGVIYCKNLIIKLTKNIANLFVKTLTAFKNFIINSLTSFINALKTAFTKTYKVVKFVLSFKWLKNYIISLTKTIKKVFVSIGSHFKNIGNIKNKKYFKPVTISFICLLIATGGMFAGISTYKSLSNSSKTIVVGEKATNEKIFAMGDLITYNGVDYKILKVETSEGNDYKRPKEGNQFLIVTVYIKNNTGEKIAYDYKNWTMSNSKGEEKKRIFTSVNVDTALYSGDLVIGGIKTGSMVFEQPKKDPKLRMNFYELKEENGVKVIDFSKKVFSVSVKVPEVNKTNSNNTQTISNDNSDNVQMVKTHSKN